MPLDHWSMMDVRLIGIQFVPSMDAKKIIALDKNCALEMVQAGDVSVEYDKLIDRQLERAAITSISGFGKIMPEASKVLVIG